MGTAEASAWKCTNKMLTLYGSSWVNHSHPAYICKGRQGGFSKEKLSVTDTITLRKQALFPSTANSLPVPHTGTRSELVYISFASNSSGKSTSTDHLSYCLFFSSGACSFSQFDNRTDDYYLTPFHINTAAVQPD